MEMEHHLTHGALTLCVSEVGAEVRSLTDHGLEYLWSGDPAVWGRRAPLCFPWCGRLKDGFFLWEGRRFENGPHGFARDLPHALIRQTQTELAFRLESSPDTLARYPWPFQLNTVHRLEAGGLTTTCTVTNTGGSPMPVQLGFHFAFALPETGTARICFQGPEEPEEILTPNGLAAGRRPRFTGQSAVELDAHLFDHDSICLRGLRSRALRLERPDGAGLEVGIEGFPCVLLWSKPGKPRFVCIEPWHGLPDAHDGDHDLMHRPLVQILAPGERFTAAHRITLLRAGRLTEAAGYEPVQRTEAEPLEEDWRLARGQEKYLSAQRFQWTKYPSDPLLHDHCEFCWHKFMGNSEGIPDCSSEGYRSLDKNYWVCKECFEAFRDRLSLHAENEDPA